MGSRKELLKTGRKMVALGAFAEDTAGEYEMQAFR